MKSKEHDMKLSAKLILGALAFGGGTGIVFARNAGGGDEAAMAVVSIIPIFVLMLILLDLIVGMFMIVSIWKVFVKAGQPGWAAIIPIYNTIVFWQISRQPIWALLLLFIPCVGVVGGVMIILGIAKAFGKGVGFALGLAFLPMVFYPILAFGSAEYRPDGDAK
jgi:hypothetical protein